MLRHYEPAAAGVIQVLRLTPRNHEGQYVIGWRIDVSADVRLHAHEDAFGNLTHVFTAAGPFNALSVKVDGEVETQDTNGVVRGAVERFPPNLFLRDTSLTQADTRIRDFAGDVRAADDGDVLACLHALQKRLHDAMTHEGDTSPAAPTAAEAFAQKRGAARDVAQIFIGAAHSLGIPARYVAGYLSTAGTAGAAGAAGSADTIAEDGGHAWAEAFVPGLGWVGFDAVNCICPTDAYVRVAIGLDALGAAPVRGTRYGAGDETLAVAVKVDQ